MDKVKFDYSAINVGDLVFTSGYSLLSFTIRGVSAGLKNAFNTIIPTHVGIIVEANGQKLIAEMLQSGLAIGSLEQYNKGGLGRYVVGIKRSTKYLSVPKRNRLNNEVFNDLRHTLDYDFKGLLKFIIGRVKDSSNRYYCSEYVVHQTQLDGINYPAEFFTKVSPLDIYRLPDWKSIKYTL